MFLISSSVLYEASASHFTDKLLYLSSLTCELKYRSETFVYLEHRQSSLGAGGCGPGMLEKPLILSARH